MGKLPKEARGNVPMLAQIDKAEARIKELEEEVAKLLKVEQKPAVAEVPEQKPSRTEEEGDGQKFREQCQASGCLFVAEGRTEGIAKNNLRLHGKTHASNPDSTLNPNPSEASTTGQS